VPTSRPRTLVLAAFLLVAGGQAAAQSAASGEGGKTALIRQILDVTHAADQVVGAIEATVPAQRAGNPRIPALFWDRFLVQARARRVEFLDSLVPLYSRTFEVAELEALLQFYRSSLGQRLLDTQPALMRESVQIGQRWGARIGAEIGEQLAAEGVRIQP
jgi:uncharacterized protein